MKPAVKVNAVIPSARRDDFPTRRDGRAGGGTSDPVIKAFRRIVDMRNWDRERDSGDSASTPWGVRRSFEVVTQVAPVRNHTATNSGVDREL
jgi:hypothetical protein